MTPSETKDLLKKLMRELVPGEKYEILVEEIEGQLKMELISESKRAIVAWSELSFMLEEVLGKQFDENID